MKFDENHEITPFTVQIGSKFIQKAESFSATNSAEYHSKLRAWLKPLLQNGPTVWVSKTTIKIVLKRKKCSEYIKMQNKH